MRRAVLLVVLASSACDNRGKEGAGCFTEGSILMPVYRCDPGLVCNTARRPPVCEQPNSGAAGAPCDSDQHCRVELWCPPGIDVSCGARLKEGEPCPAGVGCEAGLRCEKGDAGILCAR